MACDHRGEILRLRPCSHLADSGGDGLQRWQAAGAAHPDEHRRSLHASGFAVVSRRVTPRRRRVTDRKASQSTACSISSATTSPEALVRGSPGCSGAGAVRLAADRTGGVDGLRVLALHHDLTWFPGGFGADAEPADLTAVHAALDPAGADPRTVLAVDLVRSAGGWRFLVLGSTRVTPEAGAGAAHRMAGDAQRWLARADASADPGLLAAGLLIVADVLRLGSLDEHAVPFLQQAFELFADDPVGRGHCHLLVADSIPTPWSSRSSEGWIRGTTAGNRHRSTPRAPMPCGRPAGRRTTRPARPRPSAGGPRWRCGCPTSMRRRTARATRLRRRSGRPGSLPRPATRRWPCWPTPTPSWPGWSTAARDRCAPSCLRRSEGGQPTAAVRATAVGCSPATTPGRSSTAPSPCWSGPSRRYPAPRRRRCRGRRASTSCGRT